MKICSEASLLFPDGGIYLVFQVIEQDPTEYLAGDTQQCDAPPVVTVCEVSLLRQRHNDPLHPISSTSLACQTIFVIIQLPERASTTRQLLHNVQSWG